MNWEETFKSVEAWLTTAGIKVLIALILFVVAFKLIDFFSKKIEKKAEKKIEENKKIDKTVFRALSYITKIGLKVFVCVCLIGYLGLDTSGFTALIASFGVSIGLAINGTLSNFAGGVLMLITRPFSDDDYISACGYEGTVEDIFICNTKIRTIDNKVVFIPNGKLSTSEVVNYSKKETRRVDQVFSVSYSTDFEKAQAILKKVCDENPLILKDPAPAIRMSAHSASSIDIKTMVWCKTADYWTVYFDMLESVKKAFDENGIEIPFNQLDVHMKEN